MRLSGLLFLIAVISSFFISDSAVAESCVSAPKIDEKRLGCVWQTKLNPQDVGKPITKEMLFGAAGVKANTAGTPHRAYVGKAPDGSIALEVRTPQGNVPHWDIQSRHLEGKNATQAAIAFEMYVPSSFRFPAKCDYSAAYPGQGRWPYGLWIGGSGKGMGGGAPLAVQDGVSVRMNRRGGHDGQLGGVAMYVYNLNRGYPQCVATNTCSASCSGGVTGKCYGSGGDTLNASGISRDRWVSFEMLVNMNEPGKKNGSVTIWRDGQIYQQKAGLDLGRDKGWFVKGFYGYEMWHCQPSPKAQSYWFRNLRLYANSAKPSAPLAESSTQMPSTKQGISPDTSTKPSVSSNGSVRRAFELRIDSGNLKSFVDSNKKTWIADSHLKVGANGFCSDKRKCGVASYRPKHGTIHPVAATWRWNLSGYAIPVPYGTYMVNLYFEENNSRVNGVGKRVFDVEVEEKKTVGLDVFKEARGRHKTIVKTYEVMPKDGVININFIPRKDNTMISGIEIIGK